MDGEKQIASYELRGIPLCRPCYESLKDSPELLPAPQNEVRELREHPTDYSHDVIWLRHNPTLSAYCGPPRPFLAPTLMFCWNMVRQAFFDARTTRFGLPSLVALDAVQWIQSESEEPGSFRWCAHWLSWDPQRIRAEGLPDPHGQGRLGGLPIVRECWGRAAERFRQFGPEKRPHFGGRTRRSAKEVACLDLDPTRRMPVCGD